MRTYKRKRPEYQAIEGVTELCRLCLTKPDESVPIFTENYDGTQSKLALRIMMCVGLEVSNNEDLPNHICGLCHKALEEFYSFRKKCEVSYQKLKYHLLAVKEKDGLEYGKKQETKEEKNLELWNGQGQSNLVFTVNSDGTIEISESISGNSLNNDELVSLLKKIGPLIPQAVESNTVVSSDTIQSNEKEACNNETTIEDHLSNLAPLVEDTQIPEPNTIVVEDTGPCPDISSFLTNTLLGLGVVTQDGEHILLRPDTESLELEMSDGSQITFEILEQDQHKEEEVSATSKEQQNPTIITHKPTDITNGRIKYGNSSAGVSGGGVGAGRARAWCAECGRALGSRSALARHARDVHQRARPHACARCGKTFGQRNVMIRHMLVHEEKRPHQCPECPKSFTQRGALAAHRRSHAPPTERPLHIYQCPQCPKVFLYHSGLSRHCAGAHAGKLHRCARCRRAFADRSSLSRHLKLTQHGAVAQAETETEA